MMRVFAPAAVALGLLAPCASAQDTGLADALSALAPDFALMWQASQSTVISRAEAEALAARFDLYAHIDEGTTFNTDTLTYSLEDGVPLTERPGLVRYSIVPDQHVMNGLSNRTETIDPVVHQYVGCGLSLEAYWNDADLAVAEAAFAALPLSEGWSAEQVAQNVAVLLSWHDTVRQAEEFHDMPAGTLPPQRTALLRNCGFNISVHSADEYILAALGQVWRQQIIDVGTLLSEQPAPDDWVVLYDPFSGDVSEEPMEGFMRVSFGQPLFSRSDASGPPYADGTLQELEFEPRLTPRFSDVYGRWSIEVYLDVDVRIELTQEQVDDIAAGRVFEKR